MTTPSSITITFDDRNTYAIVADHDPMSEFADFKAGRAKCAPEDSFDTYEGARIALARAFGKDPFPDADKPWTPSFRVGDIIKGPSDTVYRIEKVRIGDTRSGSEVKAYAAYTGRTREGKTAVLFEYATVPTRMQLIWRDAK